MIEHARPSVPHDSSSSSSGGVVRRSDVIISPAEFLCFGKERETRGQCMMVMMKMAGIRRNE